MIVTTFKKTEIQKPDGNLPTRIVHKGIAYIFNGEEFNRTTKAKWFRYTHYLTDQRKFGSNTIVVLDD